jgi:hypothetical protein
MLHWLMYLDDCPSIAPELEDTVCFDMVSLLLQGSMKSTGETHGSGIQNQFSVMKALKPRTWGQNGYQNPSQAPWRWGGMEVPGAGLR